MHIDYFYIRLILPFCNLKMNPIRWRVKYPVRKERVMGKRLIIYIPLFEGDKTGMEHYLILIPLESPVAYSMRRASFIGV